jgi:hypothetical protein
VTWAGADGRGLGDDRRRRDRRRGAPPVHRQGHYHETYRLVDSCWRIASWKLTRLRVDQL